MNKTTRLRTGNILLCVAMTALLLTVALPLFNILPEWSKYAFAAAAVGVLVAQILIPSPSEDFRVKRLARMNVWSGIVYCVAAYCPFSSNIDMQRAWVAFLLAGAVLQIYATLMISKLTNNKKEKDTQENEKK